VLFGGLILRRALFAGESSGKESAHSEQKSDAPPAPAEQPSGAGEALHNSSSS
jgi:hypothetical protein